MAAVLVTAYLLAMKPLIDDADKAVRPATHRLDRISRCVERADGNAHKIFRCSAKF